MFYREGRNQLDLRDLLNFPQMLDFILKSTAMKIYVGLGVLLIVLMQAGSNFLIEWFPELKTLANAGSIYIIGIVLGFLYMNYIMAMIVGINEYRFWKYLLISFAIGFVLDNFVTTSTIFIEVLVRIAVYTVGIGLLHPRKATLRDAAAGWLVSFGVSFIIELVFGLLGISALVNGLKYVNVA